MLTARVFLHEEGDIKDKAAAQIWSRAIHEKMSAGWRPADI